MKALEDGAGINKSLWLVVTITKLLVKDRVVLEVKKGQYHSVLLDKWHVTVESSQIVLELWIKSGHDCKVITGRVSHTVSLIFNSRTINDKNINPALHGCKITNWSKLYLFFHHCLILGLPWSHFVFGKFMSCTKMFWSLVHKEHAYLLMYSSAWKLLFYMLLNMKSTQQTAGSVVIWKEVVRPSFVMTAIEHFQYGNISQQVFDLDVKDNLNFTAKDKVRRATITLSHEFLIYGR